MIDDREINLERQMKESYLNYSMSVITQRALPDVRDGLKPVHRRIVYAMEELGVTPDKPYRKSAKITGDVMGNYHPHGNAAIYDAMVRLAQDFNTRYPLVDGHGNFGSIDGYGAAAERYTEARMSHFSMELLRDIRKNTIDFKPNYDGERLEPVVLPSRFPNLLVNGSAGIAVGMATNMAPHNLTESIDGVIEVINNPDVTIDELMKIIKAPDFPTGGNIIGFDGIKEAYRTGRGRVKLRAKVEIEEGKRGRTQIVATEIPYQVNKIRLIERIAELVKDKKIEGISGVNDESDRNGMRIVVDVRKDFSPQVVLNNLFKQTQFETTFGIINLCLVDGVPKVLNLKELIEEYVKFQREVVIRRTKFDLEKAEARDHIVQGLLIAIDNIDEVIKIIRESYDDASQRLMDRFKLSEVQAGAILDMRLRRLQGLEKEKLEEEHLFLTKEIARLKEILSSMKLVDGIIIQEITEIKNKFGDDRRTGILPDEGDIELEDVIEEEDVIITLTHFGYIKRTSESEYRAQKRGGKGIAALTTREEDFVEDIYITSTHDKIYFFTSYGKVFAKRAFEIPEGSRTARGTAVINLLDLEKGETINSIVPISKGSDSKYFMFITKNGLVKRTEINLFENIRSSGIIAIGLRDGDELVAVRQTTGDMNAIIVSEDGQAIRFDEDTIRPSGRTAMGVIAMRLDKGDAVIGMEVGIKDAEDIYLLTISENGFGKRTLMSEYRTQNRGGKGVICYKPTGKTGKLVGVKVVTNSDDVLLITNDGTIIRVHAKDISEQGRATRGVTVMNTEDAKIVSIAKVVEEED